MDWNLVNPWAKRPPEEKEDEQQEAQEKPPVSPVAHKYMTGVIFLTMAFVVVGGLGIIVIFHDRSAKFLFGMLAILVFLATLVFGAALYISLGFLQRTMLEAKRKKEAESRDVEPAEKWDMPKRKGRA